MESLYKAYQSPLKTNSLQSIQVALSKKHTIKLNKRRLTKRCKRVTKLCLLKKTFISDLILYPLPLTDPVKPAVDEAGRRGGGVPPLRRELQFSVASRPCSRPREYWCLFWRAVDVCWPVTVGVDGVENSARTASLNGQAAVCALDELVTVLNRDTD